MFSSSIQTYSYLSPVAFSHHAIFSESVSYPMAVGVASLVSQGDILLRFDGFNGRNQPLRWKVSGHAADFVWYVGGFLK